MRLPVIVLVCVVVLAVIVFTCDDGRTSLRDPAYWIEQTRAADPQEFIAQLDHEDPFRRRRALQSLSIVGPKTAAVVPAVIRMLEDEDADVRKDAAASLASMAEAAVPAAIDPLVEHLTDPSFEVRGAVAFALSRMAAHQREGLRVPLIRALRQDHRTMQIHAAFGLGQLAGDDEALAALVDALGDDQQAAGADVRKALGEAIALHGERAMAFLELALAEPTRRLGAIEALGLLGLAAREHGDTITGFLDEAEGDYELQRSIARALASIGADPELALPRLRRLLTSERTSVQMAGASAIASLGEASLPMLREMVAAGGDELEGALRAAAELAAADLELEASIIEVVSDSSLEVDLRRVAARALGKMAVTPDRSLAALLPIVQEHGDANLRHTATSAIRDFGPRAVGAIPALVESLRSDANATQRQLAARALAEVCQPAEGKLHALAEHLALPVLRERLEQEKDKAARQAIEQALESLEGR